MYKSAVLILLIFLNTTCAHAIHLECARGTIHHNKVDALIEACKCDYIDVVKKLIDAGVEINVADSGGWTPLMTALGNSNYEIADFLIKRGANVDFKETNDGEPAMFMAVGSASIRRVKYLISKGANVNERNRSGMTPIFLLNQYKELAAIVSALIEAGADVNARDEHGKSVLSYFKERSETEVINLLIANGAKE